MISKSRLSKHFIYCDYLNLIQYSNFAVAIISKHLLGTINGWYIYCNNFKLLEQLQLFGSILNKVQTQAELKSTGQARFWITGDQFNKEVDNITRLILTPISSPPLCCDQMWHRLTMITGTPKAPGSVLQAPLTAALQLIWCFSVLQNPLYLWCSASGAGICTTSST